MKKLLFLLSIICTTCFGQEAPCPPNGGTPVNLSPFTFSPFNPTENPRNPRLTPQFTDDRLVYWIHGLGGNIDSWAKVAQATQYQPPSQKISGYPARKITSVPLTYSQFSLSGAASTLHNMLVSSGDPLSAANNITDKSINFIVAHSQGGLVSRATDKMYGDLNIEAERRFGGIVTFGTPHNGAMIINNINQFEPFMNEACNALIAGPAEDLIQSKPVIDFFLPDDTWDNIQTQLCQFLANEVAPITFKDQFQPLADDYKVGAAPLAELNSYNSTIPKIAFYGTEEEPVLYRSMYSLKVKAPNLFPHFQADDDQPLVDNFNGLLNKYKAKYEEYKSIVTFMEMEYSLPCNTWDWIFRSAECTLWENPYKKMKRKRDTWKEGVNWLKNSNNKYKAIIGALESHWITTYTCSCNGANFPSNSPNCPPGCSLINVVNSLSITEKPNDGVVLAESAAAFPGAHAEEMTNSNHMQMRNDSNTRRKLIKVLEGGFDPYFATDVR